MVHQAHWMQLIFSNHLLLKWRYSDYWSYYTLNEYKKYIEKDGALERRFQKILVHEPSFENTVDILHGIKNKYEHHHNVKLS